MAQQHSSTDAVRTHRNTEVHMTRATEAHEQTCAEAQKCRSTVLLKWGDTEGQKHRSTDALNYVGTSLQRWKGAQQHSCTHLKQYIAEAEQHRSTEGQQHRSTHGGHRRTKVHNHRSVVLLLFDVVTEPTSSRNPQLSSPCFFLAVYAFVRYLRNRTTFRGSIVVSISARHAEDPGSIPGRGDLELRGLQCILNPGN